MPMLAQADRPERRGRPRKADVDKLRPLTINISQAAFDVACALAKERRVPPAVLLRDMALHALWQSVRRGRGCESPPHF